MKTIIVGGVAGGASAAARLRRLCEQDEIVLLERGEYISFANCGLPYYLGGVIRHKADLLLQTPESFAARFAVDVRVRQEVVAIHPQEKYVTIQNHITGEKYTESYDKLLLSTGAEPIRPPLPGMDLPQVFTLRTVPDVEAIKQYIEETRARTAVVVGGGYIGVEMAENLHHLGLDVTIVEMADHLVAPLDYDMAAFLHRYIEAKGVKLKLQNGIQAITPKGQAAEVQLQNGTLPADVIIMAVGVRPESRLAKEAGLALSPRGSVVVNEQLQTSHPDIYAVGDMVEVTNFVTGQKGFIPLAGPANRQGRIAADNIAGGQEVYAGTLGSAVLKVFGLAVAVTGINEKMAKEAGLAYDKVYLFPLSNAGYYPGGSELAMKVLFEKGSGRILGAQVLGEKGADKRCDVLAAAIHFGADAKALAALELCYAPPYGSAKDPVNMAGFMIENILSGKVKQYYWEDLPALPKDGSVTLLDVRTHSEAVRAGVEGFMHIPLDELRGRIDELPAGKPVYIHCYSGQRSYIACRILAAHGYECYNFAGGWRLYAALFGA